MSETGPSSDRFEMRGELGSGGMGTVYRVLDRVRGEEVALKVLRATSGRDLFRFKREFRGRADLVHPNLVTLFELFTVENEWMFTMELVHGVGFREWVRPAGPKAPLALDRLRDTLGQLADGLTALHLAGKVHRDLKPSNVMVQDDGRAVILDFGLVADVVVDDRTHSRAAVGTPGYMAPEQAADRPVTAASDWYALGTMLYEVLAGRRPYQGTPIELVRAKQEHDPPPIESVAPDAPGDLARLCTMLLARDPDSRPIGTEVLAALGRLPSPWTLRIADRASRAAVVGRDAELAILRDALAASRDHVTTVVVEGPCGSGKTTFLGQFADEARAAGALVLAGRADAREDVPYRALDHLVDQLASHLSGLDRGARAALLPPAFALLARVFQTLRRVPEAKAPLMPGELPADPEQLRLRAFAALQEILRRLGEQRALVAIVDDIHAATEPGALATLDFFQGPAAPRLLMVFSYRTEEAASPPVAVFGRWQGDLRRITLAALPAVLPGDDGRAGS